MPTQDTMYGFELQKLDLLEKQLKEKRERFYGTDDEAGGK